jgi:hypothetical protein
MSIHASGYKTSDGNVVADVDIETGTLNDAANDCGGGRLAGPRPISPRSETHSLATSKANENGQMISAGRTLAV